MTAGRSPDGSGSRPSDRAADGVSPVPASLPNASDFVFTVDEYHRWSVFAKKDALAIFDTWDAAYAYRNDLTGGGETHADDTPTWTPKSGGY